MHLDGYNLSAICSPARARERREFFYWTDDDGDLAGLRYDQYKVVFMEQLTHGLEVWMQPLVRLRAPKLFNLRSDPLEREQQEAGDYDKWFIEHLFVMVPAQAIVAKHLETFREFPSTASRSRAASRLNRSWRSSGPRRRAISRIILRLKAAKHEIDPFSLFSQPSALASVRVTTDRANPNFVAPEDRIAVFDQDGTLWVEHPIYTQVVYCLERVPAVVAKQPKLKNVEPFKTVLSGNREAIAKLTMHDLEKILAATLTGMTVDEFNDRSEEVDRHCEAPKVESPLHRARLSADARSAALSARQWLQDLHRHRGRPGLRARVCPTSLWRPPRAGGGHGGRNEIRLRQGR